MANKHVTKVKAVRVNGQITEVKQFKAMDSTKMGEHLGMHFVLFSIRLSKAKILAEFSVFVMVSEKL